MPAGNEIMRIASEELRDIDGRAAFWVDTVVATARGSTSDDVDWATLDWARVRAGLDEWLSNLDPDTLDPSTPEAVFPCAVPDRDDVQLLFRARTRSPQARGQAREPSLVLAEPPPIPDLQFEDGDTASLYALPIQTVRDLAIGHRRLAIELPSHRDTWTLLLGIMEGLGHENTSEIHPRLLEPTASALGYIEAPEELGDFDETWRAIHGFEFPVVDDPRDQ